MNEAKREQLNRVVAFLDGKQEEMVSLLEKLVKQESGNTDKAGCDAMGAMMEQELKKLGAQTQVIAMEKKGNFVKGELGTGRSGISKGNHRNHAMEDGKRSDLRAGMCGHEIRSGHCPVCGRSIECGRI